MERGKMREKLIGKFVLMGLIGFAAGISLGYLIKPVKIVRTEFKTIEKEVSVCDRAITEYEKAVCFAVEGCRGTAGLENFTYDGFRSKTDFNCKQFPYYK